MLYGWEGLRGKLSSAGPAVGSSVFGLRAVAKPASKHEQTISQVHMARRGITHTTHCHPPAAAAAAPNSTGYF